MGKKRNLLLLEIANLSLKEWVNMNHPSPSQDSKRIHYLLKIKKILIHKSSKQEKLLVQNQYKNTF